MPNRTEYKKITTYQQAFEQVLGIRFDDKLKSFVKDLEKDGHAEKSISFSIWRTKEILLENKSNADFMNILKEEILKYSWTKDDSRWNEHKKKKELERKIGEFMQEITVVEYAYFIQGINGGAIKIGGTINPLLTVKSLSASYPDNLKVLLIIPERYKNVQKLQEKFEHLKLKGGWYKPDKEIFDEIKNLKEKNPYIVGD